MADTKYTGLSAATVPTGAEVWGMAQGGNSVKVTASQLRQYVGAGLSNASITGDVAGYAADTYLAGSAITIPTAGGWAVGTQYRCDFNMIKTAAGTAAFTTIVRMGTLGTTGDAAILTLAFGAGTAAADTGQFQVRVTFRIVGGGSSAFIKGTIGCSHYLAATGLISTGASGFGQISATSAGFDSTTPTIIGLSVNGGASFSGTNEFVQASALKV